MEEKEESLGLGGLLLKAYYSEAPRQKSNHHVLPALPFPAFFPDLYYVPNQKLTTGAAKLREGGSCVCDSGKLSFLIGRVFCLHYWDRGKQASITTVIARKHP